MEFIISHFIVLLIPTIMFCGLVYGYTKTQLEKNEIASTSSLLSKSADDIDSLYRFIDDIAYQLSYNKSVYDFDATNEYDIVDFNFLIKDIMRDLGIKNSRLSKSSSVILSIISLDTNVAVTNQTKDSIENFIFSTAQLDTNQFSFDSFKSFINNRTSKFILPASISKAGYITYVKPLDIYGVNSNTYLIALISENTINNLFDDTGFSIVIDRDGNKICSNNNEFFSNFSVPDQKGDYQIESKKYIILGKASKINNMSYISVVPKSYIKSQMSYIYEVLIIFLTVLLTIGVSLSYIFSKRNYQPIRNLIKALDSGQIQPVKEKGTSYEFEKISNSLMNLRKNNKNLQNQIAEQLPILKNFFFTRLLKEPKYSTDVSQDASLYDISFKFNKFAVFIAMFKNNSSYLALDIFKSTMTSKLPREYEGFDIFPVDESDGTVSIIVNFNEVLKVRDIALTVAMYLTEDIILACSSTFDEPYKIHEAYLQSRKLINYSAASRNSLLIFFDEVNYYHGNISYPIEKEQIIMNLVRNKKFDEITEIIDNVVNDNINVRKLAPHLINILLSNMLSTMLKISEQLNIPVWDVWNINQAEDYENADITQKTNIIKQVAYNLCEKIDINQFSHAVSLKNRILEYINNNYSDVNLSLNSVADNFNLSPQYLSTFFKSQTGQNLSEYLSQYRLNISRELLKDKNKSVADIAELVGYSGSSNFIRVYKKYYKITPGQYRDSI
jgi:two-component system, response regulator YesN